MDEGPEQTGRKQHIAAQWREKVSNSNNATVAQAERAPCGHFNFLASGCRIPRHLLNTMP
eukprot:2791134-Amphidinium_carterae.2